MESEKRCVECKQVYDTPHKENCTKRRTPLTPQGKLRVLVKMEDVSQGEGLMKDSRIKEKKD